MYKLWCLMIYGFIPKWEIIKEGPIHSYRQGREPIAVGRYYTMQCEQTGKIKRINAVLPGWI